MMVGGASQYGGHQIPDLGDMTYPLPADRQPHHSTASLIDSIERRTQRTYRYGIALVCIGATLNWLGFAQGNSYIDPLRYLGVACVICGSFCVCLAMCRWLGRPISVSGHRLSSLEEDSLSGRTSGEVHVINVAVPMYVPSSMHDRPQKPPDYEIVAGEPPPYDEAIKLTPGNLIDHTHQCHQQHYHTQGNSYQVPPSSCAPSPSHSSNSSSPLLIQGDCGGGSCSSRKASICSTISPDSPPPPYHPSPSRFLQRDHSQGQESINHVMGNQEQPLIHQDSLPKYHMSAEQEHLLGLMMRGQRSGEGSLPLNFGGGTQGQESSSVGGGGGGAEDDFSILNETNRVLAFNNSNNLQIPIIVTDGNGNPTSSSLLLDNELSVSSS